MLRFLCKVSIVDFMVMIAILMIISAIVLPHFAESRNQPRGPKPAAASAPARPAR